MSQQSEFTTSQIILGLGIMIGTGWALNNLGRVEEIIEKVATVVLDRIELEAMKRVYDVKEFDRAVIKKMRQRRTLRRNPLSAGIGFKFTPNVADLEAYIKGL